MYVLSVHIEYEYTINIFLPLTFSCTVCFMLIMCIEFCLSVYSTFQWVCTLNRNYTRLMWSVYIHLMCIDVEVHNFFCRKTSFQTTTRPNWSHITMATINQSNPSAKLLDHLVFSFITDINLWLYIRPYRMSHQHSSQWPVTTSPVSQPRHGQVKKLSSCLRVSRFSPGSKPTATQHLYITGQQCAVRDVCMIKQASNVN